MNTQLPVSKTKSVSFEPDSFLRSKTSLSDVTETQAEISEQNDASLKSLLKFLIINKWRRVTWKLSEVSKTIILIQKTFMLSAKLPSWKKF